MCAQVLEIENLISKVSYNFFPLKALYILGQYSRAQIMRPAFSANQRSASTLIKKKKKKKLKFKFCTGRMLLDTTAHIALEVPTVDEEKQALVPYLHLMLLSSLPHSIVHFTSYHYLSVCLPCLLLWRILCTASLEQHNLARTRFLCFEHVLRRLYVGTCLHFGCLC